MKQKITPLILLSFIFCLVNSVSHAESRSESRTLQVHVNVEPVFVVEVAPRNGGNTIEFGTVKKIQGKEAETEGVGVDIAVVSNLGVPYQVSQTVESALVNEEGEQLGLENFWVQANEAAFGQGRIPQPKAVTQADQLLFESNSEGYSDSFTANYLLKIPPFQPGGNYQTNIIYTIATKE